MRHEHIFWRLDFFVQGNRMNHQTLSNIRLEAPISRLLWVKVLGMLSQNWCSLQPAPSGIVDLVFFDDRGDVFDWRSADDFESAQASMRENGFMWLWESSSFYRVAGMPTMPVTGVRQRIRPIYSSGEYWVEPTHGGARRQRADFRSISTLRPMGDMSRFTDAQDLVWYEVIEELAEGHKQSHWMWFMFPQLRGLGTSRLAHYFGLENSEEAAAYWDDDVLGTRLRTCISVLRGLPEGLSIEEIFGTVDAQKLKSSMTLFESVSFGDRAVVEILDRFFVGERCPASQALIKSAPPARRLRFSI